MTKLKDKLLHIYGQDFWRGEAIIAGNPVGLKALRDTIDAALVKPNGLTSVEAMVNDGEGYEVIIVHNNSTWNSDFWQRLGVPYIDPIASGNQENSISIWKHVIGLME